MAIERERKFLPDPTNQILRTLLTGTSRQERVRISQGYVIAAGAEGELRLREKTSGSARVRLLTVKRGDPPTRSEVEFRITDEQWGALWPLTTGRRIEKTRHIVEALGHTLEIDIFETPRPGMVLIEIEFADEPSARRFEPPAWFGREVTTDPAFQNQRLALG